MKKLATWLYFKAFCDVTDSFGNIIPYPSMHYQDTDGLLIYGWLIDGYFRTKNNIEFLNDIIARFLLTFSEELKLKKIQTVKTSQNCYKLRNFQNLKSIVEQKKEYSRADTNFDNTFWVLKLRAEDVIKYKGHVTYDELLSFAFESFIDYKDRSTLKSKCKSIIAWYENHNWKIGRTNKKYENMKHYQEAEMATRKEQARKMTEIRADRTKKRILSIVSGMFAHEYRKKNGEWNITKIATEAKVARNSVYKYLKEFENENMA